jgi:hypothetical protein
MKTFDTVQYANELVIKDGRKAIKAREQEMLRLALEGHSYEEIAEKLDLALTTVRPAIQKWWTALADILQQPVKRNTCEKQLRAHWEASTGLVSDAAAFDRVLETIPQLNEFFGRERELEALLNGLEESGLVVLCGEPGIGKTGLVAELMVEKKAEGVEVVWQTIADTGAFDFPNLWRSIMGSEEMPEADEAKIDALVQALKVKETIVVLDQAELLLKVTSSIMDLSPYRPEVSIYQALIKRIAYWDLKSRLILVTQQPFDDVRRYAQSGRNVHIQMLKGLTAEEAQELFAHHGLGDADMSEVYDAYEGHPRFLVKALAIIRDIYGGDIAAFVENTLYMSRPDRASYEGELARLSSGEIAVLRAVAIEGISRPDLAKQMLKQGHDLEDLMGALQRLTEMSLVREGAVLEVNPFIRRVLAGTA